MNNPWHTRIREALTAGYGPAAGVARRLVAASGIDPVVPYAIGDITIRIPLSHELPRIRARYPIYGANQASVAAVLLKKYPDMTAIDIGANVGDTVAFWRGVGGFPVLAVEPSERYLRLLGVNAPLLGDVVVHPGIVGLADGEGALAIQEQSGTGRVVSGDKPRRVMSLPSLIRAYPAFRDAKLLKIDTDGSDGEIIIGGHEWISAAKPAIFFEFSPSLADREKRPLLAAIETLRSVGYDQLMLYDNVGEFALTLRASEQERIEELHAHALAWGEERYWDIAAFHSEDDDLAAIQRVNELSRSVRG